MILVLLVSINFPVFYLFSLATTVTISSVAMATDTTTTTATSDIVTNTTMVIATRTSSIYKTGIDGMPTYLIIFAFSRN